MWLEDPYEYLEQTRFDNLARPGGLAALRPPLTAVIDLGPQAETEKVPVGIKLLGDKVTLDNIVQIKKLDYESKNNCLVYWGYHADWVPLWRTAINYNDGEYLWATFTFANDTADLLMLYGAAKTAGSKLLSSAPRSAAAGEGITVPNALSARYRGEPFAFGTGPRVERGNALVAEATRASGVDDIFSLVDDLVYTPSGRTAFGVDQATGRRIMSVGSHTFDDRTRIGQIRAVMHEIAHAQRWDRTLTDFGGDFQRAYHDFFTLRPFGSPLYAWDEMVSERLARMRLGSYLQSQGQTLSPADYGASTRYIKGWRPQYEAGRQP
jgi:hypothetical protein